MNNFYLHFVLFVGICLSPILLASQQTTNIQIDGKTVVAQVSPDGQQVLYARIVDGKKQIFKANSEGKNARQLTQGEHSNHSPAWSPNGKRVIFCSSRTGQNQLFSVDMEGLQVKQLTSTEHGCRQPRYSKDGWLSFLQLHNRKGKSQPSDLILEKDGQRKIVARKQDVFDYCWSHDGQQICFSTVNRINFYNLAAETTTSVDTHKEDERLFSHGGYNITWSPDNRHVACRIRFLGGRFGDTRIYGDTELFLIGTDGGFEAIANDKIQKRPEAWIQRAFAE